MKPVTTVLDLESVLIPEIWIAVAEHFDIEELRVTTRDVDDFKKLMDHRSKTLRENNIKMSDIEEVLNSIEPFEGARDFVNWAGEHSKVVILSDSFVQFVKPIMPRLNNPDILCDRLIVDDEGFIAGYRKREKGDKKNYVREFKQKGMRVIAVGDSYNDVGMLKEADVGILFNSSQEVRKVYPQFKSFVRYGDVENFISEKLSLSGAL